jgi:hypothetical protein
MLGLNLAVCLLLLLTLFQRDDLGFRQHHALADRKLLLQHLQPLLERLQLVA